MTLQQAIYFTKRAIITIENSTLCQSDCVTTNCEVSCQSNTAFFLCAVFDENSIAVILGIVSNAKLLRNVIRGHGCMRKYHINFQTEEILTLTIPYLNRIKQVTREMSYYGLILFINDKGT